MVDSRTSLIFINSLRFMAPTQGHSYWKQGALGAAGVRDGLQLGRSVRSTVGGFHIVSPRAQLADDEFVVLREQVSSDGAVPVLGAMSVTVSESPAAFQPPAALVLAPLILAEPTEDARCDAHVISAISTWNLSNNKCHRAV